MPLGSLGYKLPPGFFKQKLKTPYPELDAAISKKRLFRKRGISILIDCKSLG